MDEGDAKKREVTASTALALRGLFPFLEGEDFEEIISVWVVTEGEDLDGGYGGQVSDKKQKAVRIFFSTSM